MKRDKRERMFEILAPDPQRVMATSRQVFLWGGGGRESERERVKGARHISPLYTQYLTRQTALKLSSHRFPGGFRGHSRNHRVSKGFVKEHKLPRPYVHWHKRVYPGLHGLVNYIQSPPEISNYVEEPISHNGPWKKLKVILLIYTAFFKSEATLQPLLDLNNIPRTHYYLIGGGQGLQVEHSMRYLFQSPLKTMQAGCIVCVKKTPAGASNFCLEQVWSKIYFHSFSWPTMECLMA